MRALAVCLSLLSSSIAASCASDDAATTAPEPADAAVFSADAGLASPHASDDAGLSTPAWDARSPSEPPSPRRLMILGDSITQGSAGDFTWRYRLDRHLTSLGVAFDFVGPRDDLFDNIAERQGNQDYADARFDRDHDSVWGGSLRDTKSHVRADILAHDAEILLILLGVNDLVFLGSPADAEQDLRSLITSARDARPGITIVLGRVLPKRNAEASFVEKVADFHRRLEACASELSRADARLLIARPDADYDSTTHSYDGVHPNAVGEVRIAAAFADTLATELGLGAPYPRPFVAVPLGPQTAPTLTVLAQEGAAQLSWTAAPGATGYYVWVREPSQAQAATRLPYAVRSPWTAEQLVRGASYEFQVQPTKWDAAGVLSNPVTVTTR